MTTPHNEQQKSYFSGRALPRMTIDLAETPYVQRHVGKVLACAAIQPDERILDLGGGPGKYTAAIAALGHDIEGLDLTPALIDEFRRELPDITAYVGDAALPPSELLGRFDVALGFFFLHHVEDLVPILTGTKSTLREGGRALFLEPNPLFLGYYFQVALTSGMSWKSEKGILRMRPRVLEEAGRQAGFTTISQSVFGAMPPRIANRHWGQVIERGFEALPGWKAVGAFRMFLLE